MILISHRGNISGPSQYENLPGYVIEALDAGYNVEVDVWYVNNKWMLGHDGPQYKISSSFMFKENLWVHCKNIIALSKLVKKQSINCFFHNTDNVVLTSKGYLWTYPGKKLYENSICVLPENASYQTIKCAGICSDFIGRYK